jgi:hypothetical protein
VISENTKQKKNNNQDTKSSINTRKNGNHGNGGFMGNQTLL